MDDDTVLFKPRRQRRRWWPAALLGLVVLAAGGGGVAWLERAPPGPTQPAETIRFAGETDIRSHVPSGLTIFRFAPNPTILVLDFPDLAEQGRMLNRVAAWAEKNGLPHDRLLSDPELDTAIRASGATADNYYYGHDYRGADLVRFFALAERDHVPMHPEEERLRRLIQQASAEPLGFGALISLPRAAPETDIDASSRAVILHHELSHGEYFTNAIYARAAAAIWQTVFTEAERAQFRTYLSGEGYDPAIEDLMINEMQAYLMHTPDPRFFDEKLLGIPAPRLAAIRAAFLAGMPSCWLRDVTPDASLVRLISTAPRRRSQGRASQGRLSQGRLSQGRVSRTTASAARLPPRRRRPSIAA